MNSYEKRCFDICRNLIGKKYSFNIGTCANIIYKIVSVDPVEKRINTIKETFINGVLDSKKETKKHLNFCIFCINNTKEI